MRAYRKLAAKWHPDRHDGEDRKSAEKKFMDIASAKEVLTDPGMSCSQDWETPYSEKCSLDL